VVGGQFVNPETESAVLHKLTETERVKGAFYCMSLSIERLQMVADIAKSVVLSHYETSASVFDQIEPFAASLQRERH